MVCTNAISGNAYIIILLLNKEYPFWSLIPPHVSTTGGGNESYQENAINIKTNCTRNYIRVGSYMNFLST